MRKTTNLDAASCELVSAWCLDTTLPLAAATEPVAHGGNASGVTVVRGRDRQSKSPGPRESIKPHRDAERYGHQTDGGAGEEPGGILAGKKRKPGQNKRDEQTGQSDGE